MRHPGLIVLALCLGAPLVGEPSGAISGHVTSETRESLPGVTVEARNSRGASRGVGVTDGAGIFEIGPLPAGTYDVFFRMPSFATVVRRGVAVSEPVRLDVTLRLVVTADLVVTGRRTFRSLSDVLHPEESLIGVASAASEGAVTALQLETRPMQRAGDVVETVPGAVVSQHSGGGKANQYYLRGFNLDHGTDLATTVADMPVNMPTHAHGQGYADLNFVIPELVSGVQYRKGPYFAEDGDFSAAGSVRLNYVNSLENAVVRAESGEFGWQRIFGVVSPRAGSGHVLLAAELSRNEGPWVHPDDFEKVNWVARWSRGDSVDGLAVTAMGYDARWNSTDQTPRRAVESGSLPRFGAVDPSGGGRTNRHSLSAEWQKSGEGSRTRVGVYGIRYGLDLFSNFTYFRDDPVNGDQFQQADRRTVLGGQANRSWLSRLFGLDVENTVGLQVRSDLIGRVGLYHTHDRDRLSTIREDRVTQTSTALYWQTSVQWSPRLRSVVGVRGDSYWFDVSSNRPENSGNESDRLVSPKLSLVFGPWANTELYVNGGFGFHSNDGRGATLRVDPATGDAASRVTPLARARGAELGVRSLPVRGWQSTLGAWLLDIESELVFVGDAGTTQAGRPSRRVGLEWANTVRAMPWLFLDGDLSLSRARFRDADPAGREIPGSVERVISGGISLEQLGRFSGSVRARYFGPRSLVEDGSVRSPSSTLWNARVRYEIAHGFEASLEVLNLFDAEVSDIDYYYESRLPGEPAGGVADIHTHPAEPRSLRLSVGKRF
jgi:hypothetical protein